MVWCWRRDPATILPGELKMSTKRAKMGCFTPKYSKLKEKVMEWFSQQRDQTFHLWNVKSFAKLSEIVFQCMGSKVSDWWSEILCCHDNSNRIVLVFESQTPGYKLNPISCKKISHSFMSNTEKIAQLIGEETKYSFAHFQRMVDKDWFVVIIKWIHDKGAKLPRIRFFTAPKVNFRFLKNFIQVCTIGCNMCYKCGEALRSR